jgi:hypothetical protein
MNGLEKVIEGSHGQSKVCYPICCSIQFYSMSQRGKKMGVYSLTKEVRQKLNGAQLHTTLSHKCFIVFQSDQVADAAIACQTSHGLNVTSITRIRVICKSGIGEYFKKPFAFERTKMASASRRPDWTAP